jgi:hypothetical protein
MSKVLFINHQQQLCGVYQYGYNTAMTLRESQQYEFVYRECTSMRDVLTACVQENPIGIIYNYHVSTIGWANPALVQKNGGNIKQLALHHEPHQPLPPGIQGVISQDPLELESEGRFSVGRILHPYNGPVPNNDVLTIGTFGFGLGGKGYDRLVSRVCEEFDNVRIRMHLPFAYFGDVGGNGSRDWAARARAQITKPGITLHVDHEWFSTEDLLRFLAGNDMNVFMYDDMGRGIAGTLDFALSVPRPLAITGSTMFKHVWKQVPEVLVEHNSLKDILARGTAPLEPLYTQWSRARLCADYERIIKTVCEK